MADEFKKIVQQVQKTGKVNTTSNVKTSTTHAYARPINESVEKRVNTGRYVCDFVQKDKPKTSDEK